MRKGLALGMWQWFYTHLSKLKKRPSKLPCKNNAELCLGMSEVAKRYTGHDVYSYKIIRTNITKYIDMQISILEFRELWLSCEEQIDEFNIAYESFYNIIDHIQQYPEHISHGAIELEDSSYICHVKLRKISPKLLQRMAEVDELCWFADDVTIRLVSKSLADIRKAVSEYGTTSTPISKVKGRKIYKADISKGGLDESQITLFKGVDMAINSKNGEFYVRFSYPINLSSITKPID